MTEAAHSCSLSAPGIYTKGTALALAHMGSALPQAEERLNEVYTLMILHIYIQIKVYYHHVPFFNSNSTVILQKYYTFIGKEILIGSLLKMLIWKKEKELR